MWVNVAIATALALPPEARRKMGVMAGEGGVDEVGVGPRYCSWSLNWRGC
jgi:hypothetical protein